MTTLSAVRSQAAAGPWQCGAARVPSHPGQSMPQLGVPAGHHVRWLSRQSVHPKDHAVRTSQLMGWQQLGKTAMSMLPQKT